MKLTIEGHCDEQGTTEYNLALGDRRARAIRTYLARLGIGEKRLAVISYGEERPADSGSDASAWAHNRRGEFVPDQP
jgi:peptidoglycan-associated lipoprotein